MHQTGSAASESNRRSHRNADGRAARRPPPSSADCSRHVVFFRHGDPGCVSPQSQVCTTPSAIAAGRRVLSTSRNLALANSRYGAESETQARPARRRHRHLVVLHSAMAIWCAESLPIGPFAGRLAHAPPNRFESGSSSTRWRRTLPARWLALAPAPFAPGSAAARCSSCRCRTSDSRRSRSSCRRCRRGRHRDRRCCSWRPRRCGPSSISSRRSTVSAS